MMVGVLHWRASKGRALAPLAALALSACSTAIIPSQSGSGRFTPATRPPGDSHGVIGADARTLIRLLGKPRLDIRDPTARKLQFSNGRCVLDTYLYPPRARREPVATYAEARTSDGSAMDWTVCVDQLRQR